MAGLTADTWYNSALLSDSADIEVITWERLAEAAQSSPTYKSLHSLITSGAPEDKEMWPADLQIYYHHRHALVPVGPVLLLHDRPLIPVNLRQEMMEHLHAGHAGATGMFARASNSVYWPNMRTDLVRHRAECISCTKNAPSNPASPPLPYQHPAYPFHSICSDFFTVNSVSYIAIVDRYSGWLSLFSLQKDDSKHIISVLRNYFARWGIPVELTTDGASVYVSQEMEQFLSRYGVKHRVSSSYYPRGNKRSEVAVKSAKRLVMDNLSPNGSLDTDRFMRALLIHRNQTDPVSGLSPAQVIFGRQLRDHLPLQPEKFQPRAEWRQEADQRERAFQKRHILKHEQLSAKSKDLPGLQVGDAVAVQDKSTPGKMGKWTQTGIITDVLGFQSYEVKIDGSNRLTTRNRSHLRKIIPFINQQMAADKQAASESQTFPITRSKSSGIPDPDQSASPTASRDEQPEFQGECNELVPPPLPDPTPPPSDSGTPAPSPATPPEPTPTSWRPQPNLKTKLPIKEKWIVRKDWKPPSVKPNTVSTVQAIIVTYPVSGSEGEDFTRT